MSNMKTNVVVGTLAIFVIITFALSSISSAQLMPHAITGEIRDADSNLINGATVIITNQRTGDALTVTSNNNGQYQTDLSAMSSGYQVGDTIKVEASSGELSGSSEVSVSAGPNDSCNVVIQKTSQVPGPAFGSFILLIVGMALITGYFYRRK